MSDVIIALVFGGGLGGWVFFKFNTRTGDANAGSNVVAGVVVAVAAGLFVYTLLHYTFHF